jgi:hypothetical protein
MKAGIALAVLLFTAGLLAFPPACRAESGNANADDSAVLHVLAGASSALLVSAVVCPFVDLSSDRCTALLAAGLGVCGSFVAGGAKELLDLCGWGEPEWSDLLLTVAGGLVAGSLVYAVTCLCSSGCGETWGLSAVYGAFGLTLSLPVGESLYRRFILSSRSRS